MEIYSLYIQKLKNKYKIEGWQRGMAPLTQ